MIQRCALRALALVGLIASTLAQATQPVPPPGQAGPEALVAAGSQAFSSNAISLLSQVTPAQLSSAAGSDCWGYVSPSGREYAIVCTDNGTAFVEITDPSNPDVLVFRDGPDSTWRDVKVYQDHAYAVSEGGQGIQVFNLSQIDSGLVTNQGNVTSGGATNTHNVVIDEAAGFLYRVGTGSGTLIYDLNQSLASPPFVGSWNGTYLHDAQAHTYTTGPAAGTQVLLGCAGTSANALWVLDVTDKSNVKVMSKATYPNVSYSHQGWLDGDQRYFYLSDEADEASLGLFTTTYVFDVLDPNDAAYVGKFDNGNTATGHNYYVAGDLLYEANYASGLRVFDLSVSPTSPPEVAWFDTYDASDGTTYDGLWSVYPFFPSGVVIGSDRIEGLLVFYIAPPLVLTLGVTPPPLVSPSGQTLPLTISATNPGDLQAGSETLHYDEGNGWQSVPLSNLGSGNYQALFPPLACGARLSYYFSAQSTSGFSWYAPAGGQKAAYTALVAIGETLVFQDDFEVDQGWVLSNLGATEGDWERGVPVDDPGWDYDPASDSDGSGQCYLTWNELGNTDVDSGLVRLRSPDLDLTVPNVVVQYDYYLNLTDESGVDRLRVFASDTTGTAGWSKVAHHDTSGGTAWRTHQLVASDFTGVGVNLSSAVRLRFDVNDSDPQSVVEAGIDAFLVKSLACGAAASYCTAGLSASGCQATLGASGAPSLSLPSGFDVSAASGEGSKDGLFFFGWNGQQAGSWGNGSSFQCVVPPVKRTSLQSNGGTPGQCDGAWSLDFNAYVATNPQKAPPAGVPVQLQLWYRDPGNTSNQTTSLSDALEFSMAP